MLKLIKYEYRRNLSAIIVMLGAVLLLQGYFLFSIYKKDVEMVFSSAALLALAASFCVLGMLAYSVALYSKELGAKTSYLTFMTPNTAAQILGAKLLAALMLGLFFALVLGLLAAWDFALLHKTFPEIELGQIMLEQLLMTMSSTDLSTLITVAATMAIGFLINFFTVVVIAYLSITLSATILQNKKSKGLVGFLIFIGLMAALQWGASRLPADYSGNLVGALRSAWPQFVLYLCAMAGCFALSVWLLEKKVSL
jgi:ABC-2 type transport system permease protein